MLWDNLDRIAGYIRDDDVGVYACKCPRKPSAWAVYVVQMSLGTRANDGEGRLYFKSEELSNVVDLEELTGIRSSDVAVHAAYISQALQGELKFTLGKGGRAKLQCYPTTAPRLTIDVEEMENRAEVNDIQESIMRSYFSGHNPRTPPDATAAELERAKQVLGQPTSAHTSAAQERPMPAPQTPQKDHATKEPPALPSPEVLQLQQQLEQVEAQLRSAKRRERTPSPPRTESAHPARRAPNRSLINPSRKRVVQRGTRFDDDDDATV